MHLYEWILQGLSEDSIDYIMKMRNYWKDETRQYLLDNRILRFEGRTRSASEMLKIHEWGIAGSNGEFFLENRFIIPVRDAEGREITFIGWEKDKSKYLTIPMPRFSKKHCWFNIDKALDKAFSPGSPWKGRVVVVEGIFDALMLDMIGIPCIATMGYDVGIMKGELLKIFDKVVCMPDNDKVGLRGIKNWKVPLDATFLYLDGSVSLESPEGEKYLIKCKDMDIIVNYFDKDSLLDLFDSVFSSRSRLLTLNI